MNMTTDPTPLVGESRSPEEPVVVHATPIFASGEYLAQMCGEIDRLRADVEGARAAFGDDWRDDLSLAGNITDVLALAERGEADIARLTADAERLTAANERLERWKKIVTEAPETADRLALAEQVRPIVAVWKDRLEGAEARAERYRAALEEIPLGRIYCGVCESYSHQCGCTPSVTERVRAQYLARALTEGAENAE